MKFWESVIYLSAIRYGASSERALSFIPKLKDITRSGLKGFGIDNEHLDKEYNNEMLMQDAELAKNDPEKFDQEIQKAEEWFCSRN